MHWDFDGGVAGAHILAQGVGDLIAREADFIGPSTCEKELIAAGAVNALMQSRCSTAARGALANNSRR